DRAAFVAALARYPAILLNLNRILSQRLTRTTARNAMQSRRGEAIALLVDQAGRAVAGEVVAATAATSPRGVVALDLAGLGLPGALAPDDRTVAGALALLDELLPEYGTVLVAAGSEQEDVAALLAQVDRTVALVDATSTAGLAASGAQALEVALLDGVPDDGDKVAGLPVVRAIRQTSHQADIAWLGRHLSRTKLGVALGAGGAKGYAHVATVQVLAAAGYTVDYVSGSSIGALVGSWLALGQDAATIERTMRAAFNPEAVAAMFKLSFSGLSTGLDVHTRVCRETTHDAAFADTHIPLIVMSVDLNTRQPAPIAAGPIWEALLAATALPGLFPPHQLNGQRLVDALCLVPVPVAAVATAGADITLSVNLLSRDVLPAWPGQPPPPPTPTRPGVRMLDTLMEVMDLSQLDASVRHAALADVVVTPRFGPANWREFDQADLFLAAGRAAAEAQLPALAALARGVSA
ncbi:MAG TPA: patatin-like phospholipase family protein, partial [Thermomicrobiales bacterium]|nr:patatin-like phospholipase family protein [Thermomicrobiales bacterium]